MWDPLECPAEIVQVAPASFASQPECMRRVCRATEYRESIFDWEVDIMNRGRI